MKRKELLLHCCCAALLLCCTAVVLLCAATLFCYAVLLLYMYLVRCDALLGAVPLCYIKWCCSDVLCRCAATSCCYAVLLRTLCYYAVRLRGAAALRCACSAGQPRPHDYCVLRLRVLAAACTTSRWASQVVQLHGKHKKNIIYHSMST